MIGWLNSFMFWTLLGLLVPLTIHLWNKREMKVLKVGSIKMYLAEDSPKARSILFSEPLLWFLRSLIVLLLALILVEPFLSLHKETKSKSAETLNLVEPSLWVDLKHQLQDSSVRLLADGFPQPAKEVNIVSEVDNYWDLLYQLSESENAPQKVKVFTQGLRRNYKSKVPKLNFEIEWVILNQETGNQRPIKAWLKKDSVYLSKATFQDNLVRINTVKLPSSESNQLGKVNTSEPILKISIVTHSSSQREAENLIKAFKALERFTFIQFEIEVDSILSVNDMHDWIFVFSESMPSNRITSSRYVWRNPDLEDKEWFTFKSNHYYQMSGRILENAQTQEKLSSLPESLLALCFPSYLVEEAILEEDPRSIALADLSLGADSPQKEESGRANYSLLSWFWLSLIFIFIVERAISSNRKQ